MSYLDTSLLYSTANRGKVGVPSWQPVLKRRAPEWYRMYGTFSLIW